jgi:glucosamine--fructose-6-phosphate aminotransferase (isomerizing)
MVRGSYALAVVCASEPDVLVTARQDSPLVIGLGEGEYFVASDIPAVLPYTREVLILEDGDVAVLRRESARITRLDGTPIERHPTRITWDIMAAERGGYDHFMLKEIHEQPATVQATLQGKLVDGRVELPELNLTAEQVRSLNRIYIGICSIQAGSVSTGRWRELSLDRTQGAPTVIQLSCEPAASTLPAP